jgi:hypothetical protein
MRRSRALLAAAVALLAASCARPPQAAIDSARAALTAAAGNADIVTYAPDSLRAAQEKAASLEAAFAEQMRRPQFLRRFDEVQQLAAETSQAAEKADTDSASAKAQVAMDAAVLADEIEAAIPVVESKLWAAKRVPRIKLDVLAAHAQDPADARAGVDDARRDIDAGAFAEAKAKLLVAKDKLTSLDELITEQTRIARAR